MKKESFAKQVKEELCSISFSDEHLRAFLAAFIKVNGSLSFKNDKSAISFYTSPAFACRMNAPACVVNSSNTAASRLTLGSNVLTTHWTSAISNGLTSDIGLSINLGSRPLTRS